MKRYNLSWKGLVTLLFIFTSTCAFCQTPFNQGVNLTGWFQAASAHQIQFSKFTRKDLEQIKSLGVDVIRLPINLHYMTNGEPDYTLDPLFLEFLDQVVNWAEELEIHLILDNHTFDPAASTDPTIGPVLVNVWTQMAAHYKDRSDLLYYEVLNEPHGIDDALWGSIQQTVIDAIRTQDTKHFIVVGPASWNSYSNLNNLPQYTDDKLIYTFHFYDPFVFTHQGASWTDPSMEPLSGVPFPYDAGSMPATPASLKGSWIEDALNNYANEGTVSKVRQLIDIAVNFKNQRKVPLFCGEFGVHIPNSDNAQRVAWYEEVSRYLNEKEIAWTIWDYKGGFGLFEKNSNELFEYDLNVPLLEALAFKVPEQKEFVKKPEKTGFILYDDYMGEGISEASSAGSGTLDYYAKTEPQAGTHCIYWTGVGQYDPIGFDFVPNLDLSLLKANDFVLDFWVRGTSPTAKFDIRFVDTKENEADHSWRMSVTIDQSVAPFDGTWQHVMVPLADMVETGAWDGEWFNPEGKFDWRSIDRLEIVPEHQPLEGIEFWFDNLQLAGEEVVTGLGHDESVDNFTVFPNPMQRQSTVRYFLTKPETVKISIYSLLGEKVAELVHKTEFPGSHEVDWNRLDRCGRSVAGGLYVVHLKAESISGTRKVLVNK